MEFNDDVFSSQISKCCYITLYAFFFMEMVKLKNDIYNFNVLEEIYIIKSIIKNIKNIKKTILGL